LGITVILVSFFIFSVAGKKEGIAFHRSKAVYLIIAATVLGSASALFDKYLLQEMNLSVTEVQAWFSIYSAVVMIPVMIWWRSRQHRNQFEFRWSIPAIGLVLLLADLLYFSAVAQPEALLALISPLRRSAVIVSFLCGILFFGEKLNRFKVIGIVGILTGVFLMQ